VTQSPAVFKSADVDGGTRPDFDLQVRCVESLQNAQRISAEEVERRLFHPSPATFRRTRPTIAPAIGKREIPL